ncbi:MAG: aminotransferase class IV [Candidatus Aenigmarchaeota archaeon]|nr:aminotransferase class IV [Candidatus Aenigmarchaeota archaeon]
MGVVFVKSAIVPKGKFVSENEPITTAYDHGTLYGDGVFEGIRIYNGGVFRLNDHIDRLCRSAAGIKIKMPFSNEDVEKYILETCRRNEKKDGYIRVVVTRGDGDLGLDPEKCKTPTFFIIADGITLYPQEFYDHGMPVIVAKTRRPSTEVLDPNIKMTQYINNVLCKIEANNAGVMDAIMLTPHDHVTECTGANIFFVKNGELYTPAPNIVLQGITRKTVMEIVDSLEIPVNQGYYSIDKFYDADEVFVTGTGAKICPVRTINDIEREKYFDFEKPGPVTRKIMEKFDTITKDPEYLTPIADAKESWEEPNKKTPISRIDLLGI